MLSPYEPHRRSLSENRFEPLKGLNNTIHVVFVDPFFSIKFLCERLKSEGISVSAIYTLIDDPQDNIYLQPEHFDHVFYFKYYKDLAAITDYLISLDVKYIYYGSGASIQVTDVLANIVTPAHANSVTTSNLRVDPLVMQNMVSQAGLSQLNQIKIDRKLTPEQEQLLDQWRFPIVGKTNDSFMPARPKLCHSMDEVKKFLSEQTGMNLKNILQEYLHGVEFSVSTYSSEGKHYISDVQRIQKIRADDELITLYADCLAPTDKDALTCMEYVKKVLTNIGFSNGFSQLKVMLTAEGPYLLRLNPRLKATSEFNNRFLNRCGLDSSLDLFIKHAKQKFPEPQQPIKFGRQVYLQTNIERRINAINLALLYTLPSFTEARMYKKAGSLCNTEHDHDHVGTVSLVHSDKAQIELDYQKIMAWQQSWELF